MISIDFELRWYKIFLFLLPRSWLFLLLLPRTPRIFLEFFLRSWKILARNLKIQEFSWQEIQDFSWFSCQDLRYSWFSCQEVQKFSWISFHDLEKSCKILRALPKLIAKILARNLKIQEFSWQEIQDFSWFSCQDLRYSWFSCQEVQKFSWISFHDPEKSCKILRTLPRIIAKILARNFKNLRNFLARKPRSQALGIQTFRLVQIVVSPVIIWGSL